MEHNIMALVRLWAGRAFGTSMGNLFVKLEGEDAALMGTLRLNESGVGVVEYNIAGSFDGARLTFMGEPQTQIEGMRFGQLTAIATLNPRGNLEGEWETDIGSAGTFVLYPHDQSQVSGLGEHMPDQLHTDRHHFGAIEISREQIIALAENIQREFMKREVIVTVVTGSEQSHFLENFKKLKFNADRAEIIKIFVQEPVDDGINRVVSVEFGPQANWAMVQGPNEAWVLGRIVKLKRDLQRFERSYTTNFKRFGFGINQILFVAAIVYLPSLANLGDRAILMAGILMLIFAIIRLHKRYLPFAAIYLSKKPVGLLARFTPTVASWLIAVIGSVVATLLAAYLQGWLSAFFTL